MSSELDPAEAQIVAQVLPFGTPPVSEWRQLANSWLVDSGEHGTGAATCGLLIGGRGEGDGTVGGDGGAGGNGTGSISSTGRAQGLCLDYSSPGQKDQPSPARDLSVLQGLVQLRFLRIRGLGDSTELARLQIGKDLEHLAVLGLAGPTVTSFSWPSFCPPGNSILRTLDLTGSRVLGMESLQSLSHLRCLQSLAVRLRQRGKVDLRGASSLQQLRKLTLLDCQRLSSGLDALAGLNRLEELRMEDLWHLDAPLASLTGLPKLKSLRLGACESLNGDVRSLTALANLESVDLHGCCSLAGDLQSLASLPKLVDLHIAPFFSKSFLDGTHVGLVTGNLGTMAGFSAPLRTLDLSGSRFIRGDLSQLARQTELRVLDLRLTAVVGDLSSLGAITGSLQVLHLGGCAGIRGNIGALTQAAGLRLLDLEGCSAVEGNLESLLPLSQLRFLFLGRTQITGNLSTLEGLPSLVEAGLTATLVTGSIPGFEARPEFQTLNVSSCSQISGEVPERLKNSGTRRVWTARCENVSEPVYGSANLGILDLDD